METNLVFLIIKKKTHLKAMQTILYYSQISRINVGKEGHEVRSSSAGRGRHFIFHIEKGIWSSPEKKWLSSPAVLTEA